MANAVSKDALWTSQSGTDYPDNAEIKRIEKSDNKSAYAPTGGGQSENGRIEYTTPVDPVDPVDP